MVEGVSVVPEGSWAIQLAELMNGRKDAGCVTIMGLGHPLKGDDYVGSLVAKDLSRVNNRGKHVIIVDAEDSPENFIKVLDESKPRLLVLIDSIEAGLEPGSISLLDLSETTYPFFGTHSIPLKVLMGVGPEIPKTVLLGIQPASCDFGGPLSKSVSEAERQVVTELGRLIEKLRG